MVGGLRRLKDLFHCERYGGCRKTGAFDGDGDFAGFEACADDRECFAVVSGMRVFIVTLFLAVGGGTEGLQFCGAFDGDAQLLVGSGLRDAVFVG